MVRDAPPFPLDFLTSVVYLHRMIARELLSLLRLTRP
jgi:hypothetical protein